MSKTLVAIIFVVFFLMISSMFVHDLLWIPLLILFFLLIIAAVILNIRNGSDNRESWSYPPLEEEEEDGNDT